MPDGHDREAVNSRPLTPDDEALLERVRATNERAFDPTFFDGGHVVAAGVRTSDGTVYEGVSVPASVGRASTCGEPVAVGAAVADGHGRGDVRTCVAVAYPLERHDATTQRVVPPCGACRDLLADIDEDLRVVVPVDGEPRVVSAIDLLPTRTW